MTAVTQAVHFNDENGQHYALVEKAHDDGTKDLIVWLGADHGGWAAKEKVPHGSAEQGFTYSH